MKKLPAWAWILIGLFVLGGCWSVFDAAETETEPVAVEEVVSEPVQIEEEAVVFDPQDFKDEVRGNFAESILKEVNATPDGTGEIIFQKTEFDDVYFTTGDKVNKLLAIESARLFRDVDGLERLKMDIPANETGEVRARMDITANEINEYYGLNFPDLRADEDVQDLDEWLNDWREQFIQVYDSKEQRAKFVEKFATIE